MARVLLLKDGFFCITNIQDIPMKQEMEAMMGGYGIIRGHGYPNPTYSGPLSAFEWFQSIFKMYGFEVSFYEDKLKSFDWFEAAVKIHGFSGDLKNELSHSA